MAEPATDRGPGRPPLLPRRDASDFDCPLCQYLLMEPVTTSCGHTYCKECIVRAVDHNNKCPVCRATIQVTSESPVTVLVKTLITKNFPHDYEARKREHEELRHDKRANNLPLFILDVVLFPNMQLPLHIFEPRYRLMLRRCLEGSRRLGIISVVNGQLSTVGTSAIIETHVKLPDGRSLVTTKGDRRFQLLESWDQDGYKVNYLDECDEDPKSLGAACGCAAHGPDGSCISNPAAALGPALPPETPPPSLPSHPSSPVCPPPPPLASQSCLKLMTELRAEIESKLGRVLTHIQEKYGGIPESDPRAFSYWIGSLLPVSTARKVELLSTSTTQQRLELEREILRAQETSLEGCTVS